jgi:hypothetical protein
MWHKVSVMVSQGSPTNPLELTVVYLAGELCFGTTKCQARRPKGVYNFVQQYSKPVTAHPASAAGAKLIQVYIELVECPHQTCSS